METDLKEIKQYLESTLEEFSDVYVNHQIDLDTETYLIEKALKRINELLTDNLGYSIAS